MHTVNPTESPCLPQALAYVAVASAASAGHDHYIVLLPFVVDRSEH
jgi:hypothetical protein